MNREEDARHEALARTLEALDRAASDFGEVLALELPDVVRARVLDALRSVAGVEAIAAALADGFVVEPRDPIGTHPEPVAARGPGDVT